MHRQRCPYCQGTVDVLDSDLGRMVQCDKVRCGKFFLVTTDSAVACAAYTPTRSITPSVPSLTGPHRCPTCGGEILKALNRRRCTVLHRPARKDENDPRDNCRMDVYAAIYFCPHCPHDTLLETPYDQWGQDVTCPVCAQSFQAPRDDVLHERPSDTCEGTPMQFRCPICKGPLRCDTMYRGAPADGLGVVCRYCRYLILVPSHGEPVARMPIPRLTRLV